MSTPARSCAPGSHSDLTLCLLCSKPSVGSPVPWPPWPHPSIATVKFTHCPQRPQAFLLLMLRLLPPCISMLWVCFGGFFLFFFLFCFFQFLGALHSTGDLNSPSRSNPYALRWEHSLKTTGLPGKSWIAKLWSQNDTHQGASLPSASSHGPTGLLVWILLCLYLSPETQDLAHTTRFLTSLIPPSASKLLVSQASPLLGSLP